MSDLNAPISIRDHMLAIASDGRSIFDAMKNLNVAAVELQLDPDLTTPHVRQPDGSLFSASTDSGVESLKHALAAHGVRASAILLPTDFSSDKAADHVTWAARAVHVAQQLGAPAVRVDPLTRNKELPADQVRDNFISRISQVLRETQDTGVDLGIENHGPFGNDPAFLDYILNAVDDPRLGMTLDTGNFYWWGVPLQELYGLLEKYAPQTKHTHVKNINYPADLANIRRPIGLDYGKYCCSLDAGNIDLRRAISLLRNAGYQRDYCIENESLNKFPPEQRFDELRRDVEAIRRSI